MSHSLNSGRDDPRLFALRAWLYSLGMDVTTILTAAIAGLSGITGGYLGMRQQATTIRDQLRAERERASETRREEQIDRRLQAYHDLLNVERQLRMLLASKITFSESEYAKWTAEFLQLYHRVVLTGTELVRGLVERLVGVFQSIDNERLSSGEEGFADALIHAFQQHESELEETRAELIAAMRADVAASSGAVLGKGETPLSLPAVRSAPVSERPPPIPAIPQLVLVAPDGNPPIDELQRVATAVQTQILRDFGPVWTIRAELRVYSRSAAVPKESWVISVKARLDDHPGAGAVHYDKAGRPFGMVLDRPNWSQAFSHTCLEMLANPQSSRLVSVQSPKRGQGRVSMLVQPCDPCQADKYGYEIDGVRVSDFVTPQYYKGRRSPGVRYDHTGNIKSPLQVLDDGYISWHVSATRHWWQLQRFGPRTKYVDLGEFESISQAVQVVELEARVGFFGRASA